MTAPLTPPRSAFERPEAAERTPITYDSDGSVYGHLAYWDTCHVGLFAAMGECVNAPRSETGYKHFHLGEIETAEGDRIAVGKIVLATGHASPGGDLSAATRHYDDTGSVGAFVRASDGQHGIWISGVTRSDLTPEQVRDLRANSVSGDWRMAENNLELVSVLAVPVPGFPTPRAQLALSASGEISTLILTEPQEPAFTSEQWKGMAASLEEIETLTAAALTTKRRKALSRSAFAIPERRAYPIHDRSHAANALARASGKPEEARVRRAVCRRYPDMPACSS